MKKIYEFLLWNNCSNNCSFCHQRSHERKTTDKILNAKEQIKSLEKCLYFLENDFEPRNHILLVGGEIFDTLNPEVQETIKKTINKIVDYMLLDTIDLLYLNTNLLYKDTNLLYWVLDKIEENNLFERLHFTTSYDITGRFSCALSEKMFYQNLKGITDKYKNIKIIVNTVLTNEACERIQKDQFGADFLLEYIKQQGKTIFTIKDWLDYFRVDINTIPYIKLDSENAPEMPTKKVVLKTLSHIDKIIPGYLNDYAHNIALKQEKILLEYNKGIDEFSNCSSENSDCGHSKNFKLSFCDSDECFPCAIMKFINHKT